MVDFRINWTLVNRRRELRFPIIIELSRDSEIAPTGEVSICLHTSLYREYHKEYSCFLRLMVICITLSLFERFEL